MPASENASSQPARPAKSTPQAVSMGPPSSEETSFLGLQSIVGNSALQRMLGAGAPPPAVRQQGSAPLIQRRGMGLEARRNVASFTRDAQRFVQSATFVDQPPESLAMHLVSEVNSILQGIPCAPMTLSVEDLGPGTIGSFNRRTWTIKVNPSAFAEGRTVTKVSELTQQEVGAIVDTVYHEARHCEQFFRIMRMLAGQGRTEKEIRDEMDCPGDVIAAAVEAPLEANARNADQLAEAESWYAILVGRHNEYRKWVNYTADVALDLYAKASTVSTWNVTDIDMQVTEQLDRWNDEDAPKMLDMLESTRAIDSKTDLDTNVIQHLQKLYSMLVTARRTWSLADLHNEEFVRTFATEHLSPFYDEFDAAYRDFPHELDARQIGGMAEREFNRRER